PISSRRGVVVLTPPSFHSPPWVGTEEPSPRRPTSTIPRKPAPLRRRTAPIRRRSVHRAASLVAPSPLSPRRQPDCLEDLPVPGAAAEVPRQRLPDLVLGRGRVAREEVGGRRDDPGRGEAALALHAR